ncbi:MAG TPA: SPFH domain-containing protein [Dinghuibacter sp.]|jgi:regulator of protease activity HflC (stomatin/prohibitin superfamily)|uniref:SPFH domain-containing protein n=1 Tax=Dinghuibacter sp. TaxID=2024697 RepID=UPI002B652F59|nr:SPFH domain-containing protein [Dinghuibacter sp.]HTJ13768.1 SPFH domain-containing protein [Dinghuibacter sp.]
MEKLIRPVPGFLALFFALVLLASGIACFSLNDGQNGWLVVAGVVCLVASFFLLKGIMIIQPNQARVCTFFGRYIGSVKDNGLMWINPFYSTTKVSLRVVNLNGQVLKVNDKMGNPVEIACVIVWQVSDTYKATFDVADFKQYVTIQSEASVRHLAQTCPYDNMEDEKAEITLREGGEKVSELLESELNERLAPAGIVVKEARISHLAYAQEIAGAMLQRQQATAIVAARTKIVEGAVGMVELALDQLSKRHIVELDDERKATMVSNLMVVLCGERGAQPVLNTGSLYQ